MAQFPVKRRLLIAPSHFSLFNKGATVEKDEEGNVLMDLQAAIREAHQHPSLHQIPDDLVLTSFLLPFFSPFFLLRLINDDFELDYFIKPSY